MSNHSHSPYITSPDLVNYELILSTISSISTLNIIVFSGEQNILVNILKNLPNLCQLKIHIFFDNTCIDGQQWQQIIEDYLPKLKKFRMKMQTVLNSDINKEQQIDELLNSFKSQFWLVKHR
ncbi:unnamed protein product, partial [Rotaria sp. Silwood2]